MDEIARGGKGAYTNDSEGRNVSTSARQVADLLSIASTPAMTSKRAAIRMPSPDQEHQAKLRALESHYALDWIDDLSDDDVRDLVRKMWHMTSLPGQLPQKYTDVVSIMTDRAHNTCMRHAEKNWTDYLEESAK